MGRRGLVALAAGMALAGGALADPGSPRAARLESDCARGCLAAGGDARCAAYCACVRREVYTGRSDVEIDALFAVSRTDAPRLHGKARTPFAHGWLHRRGGLALA